LSSATNRSNISDAIRSFVAKSREPLGEWARRAIALAPAGDEILAALDRVGESALVGTPHRVAMRELYGSTCATCRGPVVVEAFLWERDAPTPTKKAFRCGICAREGRALLIEAATEDDEQSSQRLEQRGMAYWQFVERFGPDPNAQALGESTAALYTPRNLTALVATLRAVETAVPTSPARDVLLLCVLEVLISGSRLNTLAGRGAPLRVEKGRARRSHASQSREVNVWLEFDRTVRELVAWLAQHPSPARPRSATLALDTGDADLVLCLDTRDWERPTTELASATRQTQERAKRPAQTQYDALRDVATHGRTVQLPFDPSEIVENLRYERYVSRGHGSRHAAAVTSGVRKAYYLARPFVPASVRRRLQRMYLRDWGRLPFPDWPVDPTVERIFERLLLLSLRAQAIDCIPFIWFWPDGHPSCAIVTHDVEMAGGRDFCSQVMDLDDGYRIKSSFQLVPEGRYEVSERLLDSIRSRGHEMAVSGFVAGITDISAPVMRGGQAAAALTVPFVRSNPLRLAMEETVGHIESAAHEVSEQLLRSDSRV